MKTYIVIHHSTTPDGLTLRNFDAIRDYHVNVKKWRDIGYHWVVEYVQGKLTAIPGRAESDVGAHCINRNIDGIGICLVGNYDTGAPSDEQYRFLARLCRDIKSRHPIWEIGGHRDYDATACPGQYFDVQHLRELIERDDTLDTVKIIVKGQEMEGKLINGKAYAPVRELVELLNNAVIWDDADRSVTIK